MSEEPNALRLAKWLDAMPSSGYALPNQAATELRRLHEVNQELLEALKLALEALEHEAEIGNDDAYRRERDVIREALAEQPAQGCEFCSHPLYAGTKCKNCGREQPAQQQVVEHQPCKGMNCGITRTDQEHSLECQAEHAAAIAGGAFVKPAQQEPVAYSYTSRITGAQGFSHHPMPRFIDSESWDIKPLFTSPPASKPWVGLTDDEIDECYYWKDRQWTTDELVRHVEAKLREKNA